MNKRRGTVGIGVYIVLGTVAAWCMTPADVRAQSEDPSLHAEAFIDPEERESDDEISWTAGLGGALNTGNTRAWSFNGASEFRLVRGSHAFAAQSQINLGRANLRDEDQVFQGYEDTARNLNSRMRYDFFLTRMDALFVAAVHRWDTFAGLDARVQGQTGYLRNVFRKKGHRLWTEVGYDMTYDNFHDLPADMPGSEIIHSARGFLGYENRLNEAVSLLTGIEALINVEDPMDSRVNFNAALNSKLGGGLSVELRFMLLYDTDPVDVPEGVQPRDKADTTTLINLVYSVL